MAQNSIFAAATAFNSGIKSTAHLATNDESSLPAFVYGNAGVAAISSHATNVVPLPLTKVIYADRRPGHQSSIQHPTTTTAGPVLGKGLWQITLAVDVTANGGATTTPLTLAIGTTVIETGGIGIQDTITTQVNLHAIVPINYTSQDNIASRTINVYFPGGNIFAKVLTGDVPNYRLVCVRLSAFP